MKKIAFIAPFAVFALAACGSTTDASEEATADTVEIPADAAMQGAPDPVADAGANVDAELDDSASEEVATTTEDTADAAAAAAADAEAAATAASAAAGE